MSKNLEKEYRALTEKDIPDLWNRIESELTPRTATSNDSTSSEIEAETALNAETMPQKNKSILFLYKYRSVLAAAICVIIILPAIMFGVGALNGNTNTKSSAATAELIKESAMEETAVEESVAVEEDAISEEAVVEESAPAAADEALEAESAPAAADEALEAETADSAPATGTVTEEMRSTAAEKNELNSKKSMSSAVILDQIQIQVLQAEASEEALKETSKDTSTDASKETSKDTLTDTSERDESGTLYMVKIVEDSTGTLKVESEVVLFVPAHVSTAILSQNENYKVQVQYDEQAEHPYTLIQILVDEK